MPALPAFRGPAYRLSFVLLIVGSLVFFPQPSLSANGVVGTGSAESCTEVAFDTVFNAVESSGGGTITFDCGTAPHTIILTAQKSISADTVIRGGDLITLSGGNATSLFQVFTGKTLTLSNIILTRGYGTFGAVENFGRLNITSSQLLSNTATSSGGAIVNYGEVSLINAMIANNTASQSGGGMYLDGGSTTVVNSQFSGNTAAASGGGITATSVASLTISGSHFSGNKTTASLAEGGGIRSAGTLVISDSTFLQNNASRGGALFVASGSAMLSRSEINNNWAAYGGGIRQAAGTLTLSDVRLAGNGYTSNSIAATTGGGAISWEGGTAMLTNVTINGNWASYGGGFDHGNATTTLTNVTISGNAAVGSGAFDQTGGSIALINVTIVGNTAPFFAGGITNHGGTLSLKNTLLAGNVNPNNQQSTNCNKTLATSSFSLSSDFTCGFGAGRDNVTLLLGALANSGGFTQTHLPQRGSPVIDAGTGIGCPQTDQRGVIRPQGQACDIGAVEVTATDLLVKVYLPLTQR